MKELRVELGERSYDITVGAGLLARAGEYMNLDRRVLVITDDGVPAEYARAVAGQVTGEVRIHTVKMGEGAKSLAVLEDVLLVMSEMKMSRHDCVVGVGGGVVGDLSGFAAAVYMRGIEFYNIPTTLLSMVDSSIGGKTAVNLGGIKNIVGAFHQPSAVLIDTDTLKTLPARHRSAGMAEVIKMAATFDPELFEWLEGADKDRIYENVEEVIAGALKIKKAVVEADERESGQRKLLNLGHTFGHGIEAEAGGALFHGECVALGMLPVCSDKVRARLLALYGKLGLPCEYTGDVSTALEFATHDKKSAAGGVELVLLSDIGRYEIRRCDFVELENFVRAVF